MDGMKTRIGKWREEERLKVRGTGWKGRLEEERYEKEKEEKRGIEESLMEEQEVKGNKEN